MSAQPNILIDDDFSDLLTAAPSNPTKKKVATKPLASSWASKNDLEERLKKELADADCNEILLLWVTKFGGRFTSRGIRDSSESEKRISGPQRLLQLQRQATDGRFKNIKIRPCARWWSGRLSALAKRGFITHTKHGYFPLDVSAEASRLVGLKQKERLEDLRKRVPDLAYQIEEFMRIYEPFKAPRGVRGYFRGSVDGLAPVTAYRRMVNNSHIISKKMASVFGFPELNGAGNILLEEVSVNQARADRLIVSRVDHDTNKVYYSVPDPNAISYHIQDLHGKEIKSPHQLRAVHLAAVRLSNRLEDFVAAVSQSPEAELYRAMNGIAEPEKKSSETVIVSLSEQPQETYDINF